MKGYEDYQRLRFNRQDRVLTVTIAGTSELNFIDGVFHTELSRVFADIARGYSRGRVAARFSTE